MNKTLLILTLFFLTSISYATTPFGRIVEVKGSVFMSFEGKTKEVRKGDSIFTQSEIVLEQGGKLTFTDNADHRYHVGELGSVAILKNHKFELRSGDLWIQSLNKSDSAEITTANAKVEFDGGEAILSYDSVKGKTQLMVINGLMKFSNLRSPELNLTVGEGNFSFVDLAFEEGMPRDPTPVGKKTFGKLISLFEGVSPLDKNAHKNFEMEKSHTEKNNSLEYPTTIKREVASKITEDDPQIKEMKDLYLGKLFNTENNKQFDNHKKAKNKIKKKTSKSEKTMIKIYGQAGSAPRSTTAIYDLPAANFNLNSTVKKFNRMPASANETVLDQAVPLSSSELQNNMNTISISPLFKESDKLIKELNSL